MPFDAAQTTRHTDCLVCPVQTCLARRGDTNLTANWSDLLAPRMALMPGEGDLCRCGERLRSLYSVRGGCIKTYTVDSDGNERIRGFYLPGDIVGLDALGEGICLSAAAAVVPSQVCVAPLANLKPLMLQHADLGQRLMEQISRELALALALSGDYSAEQRLAAFLLHLRDRVGAGSVLRPPMAQRDIGNYLRLATETVCRTLKSMQRHGWVALGHRDIRFIDEAALYQLAEPVGIVHAPISFSRAA